MRYLYIAKIIEQAGSPKHTCKLFVSYYTYGVSNRKYGVSNRKINIH